ncbi:protein-L-isoaspartate O-methyltransferase [Sphingomonas sp. MMS24-J13]|uniref:protein-L-isoaspartate O-methyltransferase family protein n=1 Tax=Sphingomonas sp. MMS24-J13 TaxID=3238686 RepID=UPI00384E3E0A
MTEHNFEQMRRAMVSNQLRTTAVNDPRVVVAMGKVPRERFVPEAQADLAYLDAAVPLGNGRALPAPMVLGRLLTEARIRPGERMLIIGATTGYAAAVAAELGAQVTALDEDGVPVLPGVTSVTGALAQGWAGGAPYDLILFDGAVEEVPVAIVAQLADGGRIAAGIIENGVTRLAIGRKAGSGFGMISFADAEVPVLPGFARPREFTF